MAATSSEIKSVHKGWVKSDVQLEGKTVLITGANTGIGIETAKDLVKRQARIIMACRNREKAEAAKLKIMEETDCKAELLVVKELDLSSLESVRTFAADINENEQKIDILLNNAGVMMCPKMATKDGFELQFGTNHLGHFLLTNLLLDLVKAAAPSRIVNVASLAHEHSGPLVWDDLNSDKNYSPWPVYCKSKLANVLFTRELTRRLEGTGVTANSLHPGAVRTELTRHVFDQQSWWRRATQFLLKPLMAVTFKTAAHGAQTSIYCAIAPELDGVSGKYFSDCAVKQEAKLARSDEDAKKLWEVSENLTGLSPATEETTSE